jgi:hypothetical protein
MMRRWPRASGTSPRSSSREAEGTVPRIDRCTHDLGTHNELNSAVTQSMNTLTLVLYLRLGGYAT